MVMSLQSMRGPLLLIGLHRKPPDKDLYEVNKKQRRMGGKENLEKVYMALKNCEKICVQFELQHNGVSQILVGNEQASSTRLGGVTHGRLNRFWQAQT